MKVFLAAAAAAAIATACTLNFLRKNLLYRSFAKGGEKKYYYWPKWAFLQVTLVKKKTVQLLKFVSLPFQGFFIEKITIVFTARKNTPLTDRYSNLFTVNLGIVNWVVTNKDPYFAGVAVVYRTWPPRCQWNWRWTITRWTPRFN